MPADPSPRKKIRLLEFSHIHSPPLVKGQDGYCSVCRTEYRWEGRLWVGSCWNQGQPVAVVMRYPDGTEETFDIEDDDDG